MKKVLSLVLATLMLLGMTTVAFAADPTSIAQYSQDFVGKNANRALSVYWWNGADWVSNLKLEKDLVIPDSFDEEVKITTFNQSLYTTDTTSGYAGRDVAAYLFVKKGSADTLASGTDFKIDDVNYRFVTESNVKKWDVEVALSGTSGTWKKAEIGYIGGAAVVRFIYNDYHISTGTKESKDTVNLKADGNTLRSSKIELTTKIKNNTYKTADKDDDEVYLYGDTRVLEPKHSISKVWIELDYDAIVTTRIFDGKKIFLAVTEPVTDLTMALSDKWGFAFNRTLKQVGLTVDASTVNFGEAGTWVYAIDTSKAYDPVADSVTIKFVGKGDANLPIYEDYFFSLKELTLETEAPTDEPLPEGDAPAQPNPDGGPTGSVGNVNYNPGTGR